MRERFEPELAVVGSFGELLPAVRGVLETVRSEGIKRIGYVSGIISSDGPDKIQENIERLKKYTDFVRASHKFPVFSATDIFTKQVYEVCNREREILNSEFIEFWRNLLETGFVTDLFMTPRWDESEGATDEHLIAEHLGLNIHYVSPKV